MKLKTYTVLFALGTFFASCQKAKPISNQYNNYFGSWSSSKYAIQIWENGTGHLTYAGGISGAYGYDCVVKFEKNHIIFHPSGKIGNWDFFIDQAPLVSTTDGKTYMTLNKDMYTKN